MKNPPRALSKMNAAAVATPAHEMKTAEARLGRGARRRTPLALGVNLRRHGGSPDLTLGLPTDVG